MVESDAHGDFYEVKHHVEALAAAAGIDLARQPMPPITGRIMAGRKDIPRRRASWPMAGPRASAC
jgi:hypothetical protein